MLKKYLDTLFHESRKERSWRFKAVATVLGAIMFVAVVPAVLFLAAWLLETRVFSE